MGLELGWGLGLWIAFGSGHCLLSGEKREHLQTVRVRVA